MRSVNSALSIYIASDAKTIDGVDLYTIDLARGITLRWTNADVGLLWGGFNYVVGPRITRARLVYKVGLQTDELKLSIAPVDTDLLGVGSITIRQAMMAGDFDGAAIRLDRLYRRADDKTALDAVPRFVGRMGTASSTRLGFDVTARSMLYLLDAPFPRNTYRAGCQNTLFDAGCGLNPATFSVAGTVSSVASAMTFTTTGLPGQPDGHYNLGRFRFTSGLNQGIERQVQASYATGVFTFSRPWPYAIGVGDAFVAYPGCDRTMASCSGKWGNLIRFRGEPFIPAAETVT